MNEANEELFRDQDEWLRRMARHLVGPSSAADDLAQETWVAGIEAGAARMTLRPWLFRVLSNKASDSRSNRRRESDALHSVRREAELQGSAPDDVIADLELRERLLREVQSLDQPLRTAIHQIYFLGRSTREAGRELGVSRSTVSERAQTGLDELRARLDSAYGRDRRAWATLLAPAVARGAAVGAGGAAIQGGGIAGLMKVAGAAAVLVGAGWIGATALSESTSEPSSGPANASAPGALAPARPLTVAREPLELAAISPTAEAVVRTAAQTAEQGTQSATIAARFLLASGEPAAGANWSLSGLGANADRTAQSGLPNGVPEDWETLRGTLDADGNLLLRFEPPQSMQFFLTVWDEDVVSESWRWGQVRPDERKELGTFQFMEASEIRGFVVDEADQPIVGRSASVHVEEAAPALGGGREAREQRAKVDPTTGSFVLDAVPSGSVRLNVSGGLTSLTTELTHVEPGSIHHVRLPIDPQSLKAGHMRVKARLGAFSFREAPLPLESVWLEGADGLRISATDYQPYSRTYLFEAIPEGPLALVAEHPTIEPVRVEELGDGPMQTINLIGRSSIAWSITDPNGEAVELYSIEMVRHDARLRKPGAVLHDGASPLPGNELGGLWPGTYAFSIRTPSGTATIEVEDLEAAEARSVTVSLATITTVSGRLIRANGAPVHGETVCLILPAEENDSEHSEVLLSPDAYGALPTHRRCVQRMLSDKQGRFEFVVENPGRYLVLAGGQMRPFAWSHFLELHAGATPESLTLTLEEPSGIVGSFTPPAHLPQTGWLIQLEPGGPGPSLGTPSDKAAVDDEGRFSILSLAAGSYRLYATLSENSSWLGEERRPFGAFLIGTFEVHEGQTTEALDLRMQAPVPASVALTLPGNVGLEGRVSVSFRPLGLEGAWSTSSTQGTVDAIEAAILEPGTYAMSFFGEGWRGFDPCEISVPENEAVSITVPLDVSEHRVRLIRGGEPLRSARVTLSSPANESHRWATRNAYDVDEDGWLEARLSSGTWKLFEIEEGATGERPPAVDFAWPPAAPEFEF